MLKKAMTTPTYFVNQPRFRGWLNGIALVHRLLPIPFVTETNPHKLRYAMILEYVVFVYR